MLTIKISDKEGQRLIPCVGEVTVHTEGGATFNALMRECEKEGLDSTDCRAVLDFRAEEDYGSLIYLYPHQACYLMNGTGATVGVV